MSDKLDKKKGIQSVYYSSNNVMRKLDYQNRDDLYLNVNHKHRFYIDVETDNLVGDNIDRHATADNVKWAYILVHLYPTASEITGEEIYPHWGFATQKPNQPFVKHMGIGKQYELGSSKEFEFANKDSFWLGASYVMEVFTETPGSGFRFSFMFIDTPKIRFSYFDKQHINTAELLNDGYYQYGQTITLNMWTHVLPVKPSQHYNFEIESNIDDLEVDIFLIDISKKIIGDTFIMEEPLKKYVVEQRGANVFYQFPIHIDGDWRDAFHKNADIPMAYSVEVRIRNTKTGQIYTNSPEYSELLRITDDNTTTESFEVSTFFYVKYETTADRLEKIRVERTEQIQYIGDIQYRIKEYDPCGYSAIQIKEEKRVHTIFNENGQTVNDKTNTYFDIIRPDVDPAEESNPVEISAIELKTENVDCKGILLSDGQKHSDIKNVFNLQKIWVSKHPLALKEESRKQLDRAKTSVADKTSLKSNVDVNLKRQTTVQKKDGNYEGTEHMYEKDETHKGLTGLATSDYDLQRVGQANGASVFKWVNGYDYILNKTGGNGTITLKRLYYIYNKDAVITAVNKDAIVAGKLQSGANEMLWQFRYFWLSNDLAQHYFIPVSTCRYPNQLAQIRVFPDIEWEFRLNVGHSLPEINSHTNMPVGETYQKHNEKALEAGQGRRSLKKGIEFNLEIYAKGKGFEKELSLSYEQKIRDILLALAWVKEKLDVAAGVAEVNKKGVASKLAAKFPKLLGKAPVTVQIDYPVIEINANWKFEATKGNEVTRAGAIKFGFLPLIKGAGTLDLIACIEYIPVAGPIFKAARAIQAAIKDYTPFTTEMNLSLEVNGQIDLSGNLVLGNDKVEVELDATTTVNFILSMGVKATAQTPKLSFGAFTVDQIILEMEASAKGQTSIVFSGKVGIDKKGVYLELELGFGGVVAYVTVKAESKFESRSASVGAQDMPFTLMDPIPNLFRRRWHIIS